MPSQHEPTQEPQPAAASVADHGSRQLRQIAATTAGAAAGAAAAVSGVPSMGLGGIFAQVGNFGAVVVVCVMFWIQMQSSAQMARDDRVVFRDAIQQLRNDFREDSNRQWQGIREVAESNRRLAESVERLVNSRPKQ